MLRKPLALLLAIPVAFGLLVYLAHRGYEKSNQATVERSRFHSEISSLYFSYCRDHGQPPSKLEDLRPYAEKCPSGFEAVRSGNWIINWGTPSTYDPRRNKERVIGHENKSPDPGRFLLMGDGSITVQWYDNHLWREEAFVVSDEIGNLYFAHLKDKGKPPAELANLDQYAVRFPKGYEAIRTGQWDVSWNTFPTDNSNENFDVILARQIPTEGRISFFVLAADRSLRCMSPESVDENKNVVSVSHDIWRLYTECSRSSGRAPSKIEDLKPFSKKYPKAFQAIQDSKWRIRWGTVISGDPRVDSKKILGVEQHVPTTTERLSHYVIMADNSSRTLGEFSRERDGVVDDD